MEGQEYEVTAVQTNKGAENQGVTAGQPDGDILPCGLGIIGVPGPGGPVLETGGP